jgi:[ribosomal protein S5]-alanine N-acetyltransferase
MAPPRPITTARLRLVPLDERLARLQLEDVVGFFQALAVRPCPAWPPPLYDREAQAHSWARLQADPKSMGWYSWVFIGRDPPLDPILTDQVLIGAGGFHGRPDAQGVAEIGYAVLPEHQGLGFATEAAWGLSGWARRQRGVKAVKARTLVDGAASQRVLEKLGFAPHPDADPEVRAFIVQNPPVRLLLTPRRRAGT